jgi:hypothetical protein
MFENAAVISVYTWEQGVEDGVLAEFARHRWEQLSGGRPILATRAVWEEFSQAALIEIWNEFVVWKRSASPDDYQFSTQMNGQDVWVIEDDVFTILLPSDY